MHTLTDTHALFNQFLAMMPQNYPRLKAGRFGDFMSYRRTSFAHERAPRNFSSPLLGLVPAWPQMFSSIASSTTLPLVSESMAERGTADAGARLRACWQPKSRSAK